MASAAMAARVLLSPAEKLDLEPYICPRSQQSTTLHVLSHICAAKQSDNLAFPWAQSPYTVPLILIVLRTTSPWSLDHRGRSLQVPVMSLEDLLGKIHIRIRS